MFPMFRPFQDCAHRTCIVQWCTNTPKTSHARFFRVPKDSRMEAYLEYSGRQDLMGLPRQKVSNYRICSAHFTDGDFLDPAGHRLVWSAVPTVKAPFERFESKDDAASPAPLRERTPEPGPSGLCRATPATGTPTGRRLGTERTPSWRGRKEKLFSPGTGRILKRCKADARRYRRAVSRLQKRKSPRKVTKRDAMETLRSCLTPEFYKLVSSQVVLHGRKMKGRRWPQEMKEFALSTYFHSPVAYRHLSNVLALPTSRSLRRWLTEVPMTTGIIPNVIDVLKEATTDWHLLDRACVIIFDEMSLRQNLQHY
ncbi:uncharacterized protein [Dermacentor albipictus]|uniref:uncharacterized protein n=1 Tax=Dermacentor albipictus TaxID=60249 RepID=UPI0038FCD84A